MTREQLQHLTNIQVLKLTLGDLNLFLDTHPYDQDALKFFNHYNELHAKAMQEYSSLYEPLSLRDVNKDEDSWKWAQSPWPWEGVY